MSKINIEVDLTEVQVEKIGFLPPPTGKVIINVKDEKNPEGKFVYVTINKTLNSEKTGLVQTRITSPNSGYEIKYPKILEIADQQLEEQMWFKSEMEVKNDQMELEYVLTKEQLHAVKTVLHLFLQYELIVGDEFWNGLFIKVFPRHESRAGASALAMIELMVHARTYNEINIVLGLDTDDYYTSYIDDPVLNERMEWLDGLMRDENKMLACLCFSLTETALLFSSFAILKSFQTNGFNLIKVIAQIANQSALDEDLHGIYAAEHFNTYFHEVGKPLHEHEEMFGKLLQACHYVLEHEKRIIDMAIPSGSLNGYTTAEYIDFVRFRIFTFLTRLQVPVDKIPKEFQVTQKDSKVAKMFNLNTYGYQMPDFFTKGQNREYESNWSEAMFVEAWNNMRKKEQEEQEELLNLIMEDSEDSKGLQGSK